MTTSPRAALFTAPALIALAGAALLARHAYTSRIAPSTDRDGINQEYVIEPSVVDDDSVRAILRKTSCRF